VGKLRDLRQKVSITQKEKKREEEAPGNGTINLLSAAGTQVQEKKGGKKRLLASNPASRKGFRRE